MLVPPGFWLTGPLELKSNVRFHLERGALLQLSNNPDDFPMVKTPDQSGRGYVVAPPISAHDARNIAITGEGVIDGAGEAWRYVKREKQTEREWNERVAAGGYVSPDSREWWPSQDAYEGSKYLSQLAKRDVSASEQEYAKAKLFLRPDLIRFVRCSGILLDGPTFRNSPRFHVHPVQCENMIIRNITVITPWSAMNGDGIDLSACRNVVVSRCLVDVGDDAICIKPSAAPSGWAPGASCSKIVIADCTVFHGHGGFVIGSESYGGASDIMVRNCTFIGTDVGIRCKSSRGRGGVVERIFVDGVRMRGIANEAILFDMYYGGGAPEVEAAKERLSSEQEPVNALTPRFRDISVKNVVCSGAARAMVINGLPEMPIARLRFDSVSISARKGILCIEADSVRFAHCTVRSQEGPVVQVEGKRSGSISFFDVPEVQSVAAIRCASGVPAGSVVVEK